ncbi:MAG: efflux RND transporter periplasmic adaptor subunit, partial [Marmoricola sp.]
SGTVASLDLAPGDAVTAGTAVAVVIGGRAVTLTGTVPESAISELQIGQQARVSVPGSSTTTSGTVTAIGLTADTSTGSTTYPVTVTVEDPRIALPTGSRAQVSIVLATARNLVTLPISAISRSGTSAVVRTWNGTTLSRTVVVLGAVGSRTVAITRGVSAGEKVVVADVDQAITGASSELDQRGGFGPPGGGQFTFSKSAGGGGPVISKAN